MRWENKGQIKDRLLLTPVGGGLLCAAFTEDGIPKRPTKQERQRIRIVKHRESSPEKKMPPRGPQPFMAMTMVPKGPPLQVAQSSIIPPQPQSEQRQWVCSPQDAVGPTQGYFDPYIHSDQSQQSRQSTQLQAENSFPISFYEGRKYGRCGLFSDRTNAFAMGMPAQPMLPQQIQSQLRAQQRQSRRNGEYDVWPSATPRQTRPCRQVLQASRPRSDVPAFLRLAGTNPGPLMSQNYFYEVLSFTLLRSSRPGHGDIRTPESDTTVFHHTHFIAVPRSTYVQEFM